MLSMAQLSWLLLCLFYSLAVQFSFVRARAASLERSAEPPPITEAPQAALGKLHKRDSPICGYFDGIAGSSLTCNAPNDCYIFTDTYGFYSAKAACGQRAISSFDGPWGLCVDYNGGLCPDIASCSAVYTSVLFCPSDYPWCVRYEMRDTPSDPYYYVLLDCTGVYHSTAIQILFTPTITEGTLSREPTTPTAVTQTAAPSPTPTTPTSTTPLVTTDNPTPTTTPASTESPTTTNSTPDQTPVTVSSPSSSSSQDNSSGSGSAGLSVGDKAGIASAVVGVVAVIVAILGNMFAPNEMRKICCYCCIPRSVPTYSTGPIPMHYMG